MNNTAAILGSGSEDFGRSHNVNARIAEDKARNRRLDRDALIAAALERFEASALEYVIRYASGRRDDTVVWVSGYTKGVTGRDVAETDISALLAEIRSQLSPTVR
jgi:hypothetical protein